MQPHCHATSVTCCDCSFDMNNMSSETFRCEWMQDNCLGLMAVSGDWMLSQSILQEPSLFLSSWTESDTSDLMTRTEMFLKTLAYSLFNHLLWPLTQDSSTDVSNLSLSHSCCHLLDDATVSWKACFSGESVWFSLQQLLKPDRIVTCKCSLPGFVTFTGL